MGLKKLEYNFIIGVLNFRFVQRDRLVSTEGQKEPVDEETKFHNGNDTEAGHHANHSPKEGNITVKLKKKNYNR